MKNGIISDGCFATIRIREYQSIFYWTSDYSYINENYKIKVYWSAEELKDIIHFLWNYLKHEEKILEKNYDPFGMIGEAKNRFEIITEIAMFIIGEYLKINNDNCDYLIKELKNFIDIFRKYSITCLNLEGLLQIITCATIPTDQINNNLISTDREKNHQAFSILNVLFYLEENSGFNASLAVKKLRKILFALPFIGTEISSCVYNCLSEMLGRKLFLKQEIIGLVCESLLESYRILNSNEKTDNRFEDWATLDAMYSLASLTKKYYSVLSSAKMKIPEEMLSLISMFKKDISPEVRNQWEE